MSAELIVNELLTSALSYAERGWPVFPCYEAAGNECGCGKVDCGSPGKHPHTKKGLKDATTDPEQIRKWWKKWPDANVAIVTDTLVVVDVDPRHGGDETLASLKSGNATMPETVEALTGGSGRHLFFRKPEGAKIGSRNKWRTGIDIKAAGGYVVAAPSNHTSGNEYQWRPGHAPDEIEVAEIPAWLLPMLPGQHEDQRGGNPRPLTRTANGDGRSLLLTSAQQYAAKAAPVNEGGRDDAAFKLAGQIAAFQTEDGDRLNASEILDVLTEWNARNNPPLPDGELKKCANSALKNGKPRPPKIVNSKDAKAAKSTGTKIDKPASDEQERKSQATLLQEMTVEADLFHNPDGEAYARFAIDDGAGRYWHVARIRTKAFKQYLVRRFYLETGKVPSAQSLQDALGVIEAKAIFEGGGRDVFIRVAQREGRIYFDLCTDRWHVVEIDKSGWRIVDTSPVMLRRAKGMRCLPMPDPKGNIGELRRFINVSDEDWALVLAWLVAAMRPTGPYPVLAVHGEHGAAKSTLCRLLRLVVDPNVSPLRADHREPRDLMICANSGWIVALDNLSNLPPWLSDCLCRLSTGGGFSTRTLYENDEETIFDAQRPVILNCIDDVVTRSDLLDRCLLLNLPRIDGKKRISEAQLNREFEEARPRILGGLLNAVSVALLNESAVTLPSLPRMADFAVWATAAEPALGLREGEFLANYQASREAGNEVAIEASPVGKALLDVVKDRATWSGTATELLSALESKVDEKTRRLKSWPATARTLAGIVKRLAPNLRDAGVGVEFGRTGRSRSITLTGTERESCVTNVTNVTKAENQGAHSDDAVTQNSECDASGLMTVTDEERVLTGENGCGDANDDGDADLLACSTSGEGWGEL